MVYCILYTKYTQVTENSTMGTYSQFIIKLQGYIPMCESTYSADFTYTHGKV